MTIRKTASALAGVLLGGLLAVPAQAAILTYDFSFNATGGSLAGNSYNGSYAFDDALAPTATIGSVSQYALSSFDFSFNGETFSAADDPGAYVAFDPAFSNPLGISYIATINSTTISFAEGFFDISEQTFYAEDALANVLAQADASEITTTASPSAVPEPGIGLSLLLALGGLSGVGLTRRRGQKDIPFTLLSDRWTSTG